MKSMQRLKINIIKWKSSPNTTDSIAEIIVSTTSFAVRHIMIFISVYCVYIFTKKLLIPPDGHGG